MSEPLGERFVSFAELINSIPEPVTVTLYLDWSKSRNKFAIRRGELSLNTYYELLLVHESTTHLLTAKRDVGA